VAWSNTRKAHAGTLADTPSKALRRNALDLLVDPLSTRFCALYELLQPVGKWQYLRRLALLTRGLDSHRIDMQHQQWNGASQSRTETRASNDRWVSNAETTGGIGPVPIQAHVLPARPWEVRKKKGVP
jgi:hypothetical protein